MKNIKKILYLPNYSKIIKLMEIKNNLLNIYLNMKSNNVTNKKRTGSQPH